MVGAGVWVPGGCLNGSWQGCRLRGLQGEAWAWPCSCCFSGLPDLVPLMTAPFSLPLAGGAATRGEGSWAWGAGREPRQGRGSWLFGALSLKGEVKDG